MLNFLNRTKKKQVKHFKRRYYFMHLDMSQGLFVVLNTRGNIVGKPDFQST